MQMAKNVESELEVESRGIETVDSKENELSESEVESRGLEERVEKSESINSGENESAESDVESRGLEKSAGESENLNSDEEFVDFSSDDSVKDKNYYPSSPDSGSSSDSVQNVSNNESDGKKSLLWKL